MRKSCVHLYFLLAAVGCAATGNRTAVRAPLDADSEIRLDVARRAPSLDVEAVSVIGPGEISIPLELRRGHVGPDQLGQRLLASGRIPAGGYSGFQLKLRGVDEPVRAEDPFDAAAGRAQIRVLEIRPGPDLAVHSPSKTLAQLTGFCVDSDQHDLTLFDKRARVVSEVLPTGRGPSGLALDSVLNRAFVALAGEDRVDVVDVASSSTLAHIRLSLGDAPRDVALSPDRRLLVAANARSNSISFLDANSWIELSRVPAGEEPSWILIDRRGSRAYVSNLRSSSITVLDLVTRSVVTTLPTDDRPLRAQLDRAGARLYVAALGSASLNVYSLPDLALQKRVYVGLGVSGFKVDAATDLIYVAHRDEPRLAVYDAFSFIPVDSVRLPDAASEMAIDDAENAMFAILPDSRAVAVVDLNRRRVVSIFDTGDGPRTCALNGERN